MNKFKWVAAILIIVQTVSCSAVKLGSLDDTIPIDCRQLVRVITPQWTSTTGMMTLYERKGEKDKWKIIDSFPVNVGRNGLAWDDRTPFIKYGTPRVKHEGDGCSPAGIFDLGPAFGYNAEEGLKIKYMKTDGNDLCIDDPGSDYYNQFISTDTININDHDWKSFENMKRQDALYEYGVWVQYNSQDIRASYGSCIFLHVWRDDHSPTSGCTSMSRENILTLLQWLDSTKHPVLIQLARK